MHFKISAYSVLLSYILATHLFFFYDEIEK
jgi:hypothetical protein